MKKFVYILITILCLFLVACDTGNNTGNTKEDNEDNKVKTVESKELDLVAGETIDFVIGEGEKLTNTSSLEFSNGKLKATEAGNFTFTYETENYIYNYNVTVIYETLSVKKTEYALLANATASLEYVTNSKSTINFASSNNTVASIDDKGVIKGVGIGTCVITISTPYNSKTVDVEVLDTNSICNVIDDTIDMEVGKAKYLLIDESNNTNEGVTFTCEQKILEVSKHGVITPVKSGTEKITVKDTNGITREITVNVIDKFEEVDFNDETKINVYGRTKVSAKNELTVYHSCSGFECSFEGTYFKASIFYTVNLGTNGYVKVYLDDTEYSVTLDKKGVTAEYTLAEGLEDTVHTIKVLKRYEENIGKIVFSNLQAELFVTPPKKPELKLEVYGDSFTAAYGAIGTNDDKHTADTDDATLSYAYVASQKLNAQVNVCCYSGISMGIPGWYKDFFLPDIAKVLAWQDQVPWDFSKYVPDIIVIYAGGNDNYGLNQKYGTANQYLNNYKAFISYLLEKTPTAKVVCCYGYSTYDSSLTKIITNMPKIFPNQVYVCKLPAANTAGTDGHPTAAYQIKGGEKLAEYITSTILPLLNATEEDE